MEFEEKVKWNMENKIKQIIKQRTFLFELTIRVILWLFALPCAVWCLLAVEKNRLVAV